MTISFGEASTGFDKVVVKIRIPKEARNVEPDDEKHHLDNDFNNINLNKSDLTQDTLQVDRENIDPESKASVGKRKIKCNTFKNVKRKKTLA